MILSMPLVNTYTVANRLVWYCVVDRVNQRRIVRDHKGASVRCPNMQRVDTIDRFGEGDGKMAASHGRLAQKVQGQWGTAY